MNNLAWRNLSSELPYCLCAVLIFIWSIPGTIALRNFLLLSGLVLLVFCNRYAPWRSILANLRGPLLLIIGLTIWLLVQALLVAEKPALVLGEISGQWITGLLAGSLGGLVALRARQRHQEGRLIMMLVLPLLATAAIALAWVLLYRVQHGVWRFGQDPLTNGKLELSFLVNLFLAVICVDLLGRASHLPRFLPVSTPIVLAMFLLGLCVNFFSVSRNGILGAIFLGCSFLILLLVHQSRHIGPRRTAIWATGILAVVAVFAVSSYRMDPRWKQFEETALIAWEIDEHKAWLDDSVYPYPLMSDGKEVDASAYMRIAWMRAGLRLALDYPLGVGYGRNAFAHALRHTHETNVGHSHSGTIDLLVGAGWPALLIWVAFIAVCAGRGLRTYLRSYEPFALLLFFVSTGFLGRMMTESVARDHMLQIFCFLIGLCLIVALTEFRPVDTAGTVEK